MLADERVRERIRSDLDTTLVIEAAAGTGKTTELVNRIVAVLASGRATLNRIVAVTFTEKAAGELKLRLRAEIERARHGPAHAEQARGRLRDAVAQLEQARIGTIHGFCADLLRERPVEAGVDPMFEVAAEDVADALFEVAFERWFEQALAGPGEGMRRILRRRDLADREGPRPVLRAAAKELVQWRDFATPWRPQPFERDSAIDELVLDIAALDELARKGDPEDWLRKALERISRPIKEVMRLEAVRGRDYDALEDALVRLIRGADGRWRWRGYGESFGPRPRAEVLARREALRERLVHFRDGAGANLAPLLRQELWPVVGCYEGVKQRSGRLDFLDLLLVARDLVRGNGTVRRELQDRFTHIFVDEFQDTDPLQAEILLLLGADDPDETDWRNVRPVPGKLFIVGDPKQSIYRFRRADVSLYQGVKRSLLECGAALEHLTVSFRATPGIQSMVNAVFAPLMAAETRTQPGYAPLEPFRPQCESQPEIVVLPVPSPYSEYGRITDWRIEESLPDAVAAFTQWLIDQSGWTVTERDDPERRAPIRPRHICVLFRRMNGHGRDVTRPYVRALEARHVPHIVVRGGSFNEREEVEALRNALGAIERPDDELAVFATLRGPLFALSDGALLQFRESVGSLHPFRKIPGDASPEIAEVSRALEVLRRLHRGRNRRPIADTIAQLLSATRAHAGIAIWPTGEQALANVMRIMDQARRYEARSGAVSLRGFVDELEARAEREEASEVPVVEEGTEGVRIMTVHRAKGLEFPVVVLADITCNETASEPRRYVDPLSGLSALRLAGCAPRELLEHGQEELRRDAEEAVRVLYVATTRARDLIVLPAVGDAPYDGWIGKLGPAFYPDRDGWRTPLANPAPGCPEFGGDSVRFRPPKAAGKGKSVAPGLHRPELGDHRVVWWDPSKLELDVHQTMGLRQLKLLQADAGATISKRAAHAYQAWRERRGAILASGARPTIRVATATELAAHRAPAEFPEADDIRIEQVAPSAPDRPHGPRFGELVHAMLARVMLDANRDELANVAEFHGRIIGAGGDEIAAAIDAAVKALGSSLMLRARRAWPDCRRECSVLVRLDDDMVVEGVADMAFLEEDGGHPQWIVVDFKTDLDINERLDEYRAQVALYMRGIRQSTGRPARGFLLWI
jgi:ATP-dependent helicase/nuclease subunit A